MILMEECAEVIQAASKLVRFGKENRPDNGVSNIEVLGLEFGDVESVALLVQSLGLMNQADIRKGITRKRERLAFFMQTQGP